MTLNKEELGKIEKDLKEERNSLKEELEKIAEPSDDSGDYKAKYEDMGSHRDENATEVEGYVGNVAVEKTLEDKLNAVDIALDKIKKGTYGTCEECEGEIKKERLKINPSAKRCMVCADKG